MVAIEELCKEDDFIWMKGLLDLLPKSVYSGLQKPSASLPDADLDLNEAPENAGKKKNVAKKKRKRVNKVQSDSVVEDTAERAALREKLHSKIMEKRAERKADDETYIASRNERKRKRDEKHAERVRDAKKARRKKEYASKKTRSEEAADESEEEPEDVGTNEGNGLQKEAALETTRLSGFQGGGTKKKVKRRKLKDSKLRELQMQLEKATEERELKQKVADGVNENAKGGKPKEKSDQVEIVAQQVQETEMDKALRRVKGESIRDDVQKLKKSIRREKRKTEVSKEKWEKRVKTLEKEQKAKQEKREKNLKERQESKGKAGKGKPTKKIQKKRRK